MLSHGKRKRGKHINMGPAHEGKKYSRADELKGTNNNNLRICCKSVMKGDDKLAIILTYQY